MSTNDISLSGLRNYAETSKGSLHNANPHPSKDLQDLKALVIELAQTRNGKLTIAGCNCHGNELNEGYTMTTCSSNTLTEYNKSTISLKELLDYIDLAKTCSCVGVKIERCKCNTVCNCNCDVCQCNCNNCGCNCDYSSSVG